ncbi:uncharacterized protein PgNI_09196 [Pyricularia grisea]|uniref:Uncharacterized protein n=1 Tax=Pyricularia grisea TaxID=148305 RepID=A0A6P8AS49_PYRGI|nr:uncharacterized protein PgNI_09196 [Pyricularia grisea]TLD04949.1 hypothetical protein PgNI_09196 [Pyricularia grisea]
MPKTHLVNNETRNQYPVQANSDSPGMGMALPSYETAPPLDTNILDPTTLLLAAQAIHAQTTDSPPLYRLSLGISDLTDLTTSVDLMRVERKGRSRPLRLLPRSVRIAVIISAACEQPCCRAPPPWGLKKVRGLLSRKTTHVNALPVDPSGKRSEFGIPTFVKGADSVFTTDGREWAEWTKNAVAVMYEDKDGNIMA